MASDWRKTPNCDLTPTNAGNPDFVPLNFLSGQALASATRCKIGGAHAASGPNLSGVVDRPRQERNFSRRHRPLRNRPAQRERGLTLGRSEARLCQSAATANKKTRNPARRRAFKGVHRIASPRCVMSSAFLPPSARRGRWSGRLSSPREAPFSLLGGTVLPPPAGGPHHRRELCSGR